MVYQNKVCMGFANLNFYAPQSVQCIFCVLSLIPDSSHPLRSHFQIIDFSKPSLYSCCPINV